MIDPKATTTYAQYNEDIILRALLHDLNKGFYVDVGANYPTIDSVTKVFYDEGWTGINIEPLKSLYDQLVEERPKDVNLQIGIGDKTGELTLREFVDLPGHSTFDAAQKKQHDESIKFVDYPVEVRTLKEVLSENVKGPIHFMKIDVEGFEYKVVVSNDWKKYRPEVLCIESNHVTEDWRAILATHDYRLFIQDGINEYYLATESWSRTEGFDERVVFLDYHALKQHQHQSWSEDSKELVRLNEIIQKERAERATEQQAHITVAALSLSDQPLLSRIRRAFFGLTVDWLKYRKNR